MRVKLIRRNVEPIAAKIVGFEMSEDGVVGPVALSVNADDYPALMEIPQMSLAIHDDPKEGPRIAFMGVVELVAGDDK